MRNRLLSCKSAITHFFKIIKNDWNLYVSVGIAIAIIIGGVLGHQSPINYQPLTSKSEKKQSLILPINIASIADVKLNSCQYAKTEKGHQLCIERRTIEATEKSADWTQWTGIVSMIGTFVVALSLIFSTIATKAALDAAKAAKDTLHNDRAWVLMDRIVNGYGRGILFKGEIIPNAVISQVIWKNSGRSPALKVNINSEIQIFKKGDEPPLFIIPLDKGNSAIAPDGKLQSGFLTLNAIESDLLRSGSHCAAVYSKIVYVDLYNPNVLRTSEVCISINISGTQKNELGEMEEVFLMSPIGGQNSVN